jgi:hypothetical protein
VYVVPRLVGTGKPMYALSNMFYKPDIAELLDFRTNLLLTLELLNSFYVLRPTHPRQVQTRITNNIRRFRPNYISLFVILTVYSILGNWKLLFEMILVAGLIVCANFGRSPSGSE